MKATQCAVFMVIDPSGIQTFKLSEKFLKFFWRVGASPGLARVAEAPTMLTSLWRNGFELR
jgi:hypothetical protein